LQWLELDPLRDAEKDAALFPTFDTVRPQMLEETRRFIDHVFWDPAATAGDLFTSTTSFQTKPLATLYGVTGPSGSTYQQVTLDSSQRRGVLTLASVMATYAKLNETHPVIRGKLIRERVLCRQLTPPPEGLEIIPPDPDPTLTTRERYKEHSTNALCAGCHSLTDPIGFGFENYDPIGAYRTTENGKTIDSTGQLTGTLDANGSFANGVELATRLGGSAEVKDCLATQWVRFGLGRRETADDACSLEQAQGLFTASGHRLPELLLAVTQTDAFLYRKRIAPGGTP
jgi:hypothetical protein